MRNCNYCPSNKLIKKGKRGIIQRYQCKGCRKFQQDVYRYKLYNSSDDRMIKLYNSESVRIRSMSRILGYSPNTIIRRIQYLASKVTRPIYCEDKQTYEVDEMWTYVGKNDPSYYSWITYAINRKTSQIMDVAFGSRNSETLGKVISTLKSHNPKKVITDGLSAYPNLIEPFTHDTTQYSNTPIPILNEVT